MNYKKFEKTVLDACKETANSLHKEICKAVKKNKISKGAAEDLLTWIDQSKNSDSLSLAVAAVCNLENLRKELTK